MNIDMDFKNLFSVAGKVIIVTGSNKGNGEAIARGLTYLGAKVVRIDLAFDSDIGAFDLDFDLCDIGGIKELVNKIYSKYGKIDSLINNAGVSISSEDPYDNSSDYDKTLSINLHAAFELCASVAPSMVRERRGSIINVTSLGAERGFPGNPSYQISKGALRQATKAMARDWGSSNVRVNNLCPGYIRTSMTEKSFNDPGESKERLQHMIIKRWGESDDLIGPSVFLVSDASAYITGTDIYVDGGWIANGGL